MGVAYKVTSPSGKSYVGITVGTTQQRWGRHVYVSSTGEGYAIGAAIRKYGREDFTVETLLEADRKYLLEIEPKLIELYGSQTPGGYNIVSGGLGGRTGIKHSEAERIRIGERAKARWSVLKGDERSQPGKKAWTSERKKKHSETMKAIWSDSNYKKKCGGAISFALSQLTAEQLSNRSRRSQAARDPQEMHETAIARQAAMTPQQRSDNTKRGWETRRRNQVQK